MKKLSSRLLAAAAGLTACCVYAPEVQAAAATEKVVYSFCAQGSCADGAQPFAGVIQVNGKLYGTTVQGGAHGGGTVFSINPTKGSERVLHSFDNNGTDGYEPYGGVINFKADLYGTTYLGGMGSWGTLFSVGRKSGVETIVHAFQDNGSDAFEPHASLVDVQGVLYGTTEGGGSDGSGTVFSLDPVTGTEAIVYSFRIGTTDGFAPSASLLKFNGLLYGTTFYGGAYGDGTLYSVNPANGAETVLHSFQQDGKDGFGPQAGLIAVKGKLYGTTNQGGTGSCAGGCGTVFSLDLNTGSETVLHSFQNENTDGQFPSAGLIAVKGKLFGTTTEGGTNYAYGAVFSVDLGTGAEELVYSFGGGGTDGQQPYAGLLDVNGTLYGTTELGGAFGQGTVFAITP